MSKGPPRPSTGIERAALDSLGASLAELKSLVATIANELDELRAHERGLSPDGESKLAHATVRLRTAIGATARNGPPPIPSARPVMLSTLDISEMAELVESLVPPPPSDTDDGWT